MVTSIDQLDLSKSYTYADYMTWQFDGMVELIQGKIFKRSPAPGKAHQEISSNIQGVIWNHLRKKKCKVFHAPFDVRLPSINKKEVDTVVQPDICVICDTSKLDDQGCNGAPDWIIEILSKGTAKKDLNEKFDLYQHAGVKEYWIVHPKDQTVLVYLLENGQYTLQQNRPYTNSDQIPSTIFTDLVLEMEEVFE